MADFKKVIERAQSGYFGRKDYPPYALAPWNDRLRWSAYLELINAELDHDGPGAKAAQERLEILKKQ